ncbi:MAG: GNAT family protein [Oscillospiraceae bacterium]
MKEFISKNGNKFIIRPALSQEADAIVEFYNFVGGETDYLSFGLNEYPHSPEEKRKEIAALEGDSMSCMLLALIDEEIAGIITIETGGKRKFKTKAELGIGIKLKYCNEGLGFVMMEEAVNFAKANKITKKICLVTRSDNSRAIALYEKIGFKPEALLKNESFENNRFYDSLVMAMFLEM